ncbi:Citrase beta chain [Intoshia linei]|uniref:Citrase beta chain n=1 Tax=Intoshia linei TaxID=1819745 RepID=A0A177BCN7_9BILA|nr:Citrase beta chain [Intoshia linei]
MHKKNIALKFMLKLRSKNLFNSFVTISRSMVSFGCNDRIKSFLYIPCNSQSKLNKVKQVNTKCKRIVLDLEDALNFESKDLGRNLLNKNLKVFNKTLNMRNIYVRINSHSLEMIEKDFQCLQNMTIGGLVVPKFENIKDLIMIQEFVSKYSVQVPRNSIPVILTIESAKSLLNLNNIFLRLKQMQNCMCNIEAIVFGSDDFSISLGIHRRFTKSDESNLAFHRQYFIMVAKAFNLNAIDMVYPKFKDLQGLANFSEGSRNLGFDGMQLIHPAQVDVSNTSYGYTEDDIFWAKSVISKYEAPESDGVIVEKDAMIDRPLYLQAKNIINSK